EFELLRDGDGRLWWLEWNPRSPAWVHGATLAGRNLPAALVRRALGLADGPRALSAQPEFTRVVLEVPVRTGLPLPLPAEPEHGPLGIHGKYGASLSAIVPKLVPDEPLGAAPPTLSPETEADLRAIASVVATPQRLFLPRTAEAAFARLHAVSPIDGIALRYAYSLKTSPDAEYLMLARKAGMLAECISLLEVRRALEAGWLPGDIVLNGPGKWWPSTERTVDGLRVVFSDSVEELERLVASGRGDRLWGVRLRIPGSRSRFGVPVDEPADFERLCAAVAALPTPRDFGIHLHMASTLIGVGHRRDLAGAAHARARPRGVRHRVGARPGSGRGLPHPRPRLGRWLPPRRLRTPALRGDRARGAAAAPRPYRSVRGAGARPDPGDHGHGHERARCAPP